MSITQFPGPIDSLIDGMLAGSKLKALQSEAQARSIQNAVLTKQLQHYDEMRMADQAQQAAYVDHMKSQTELTQLQSQKERSLQDGLIQHERTMRDLEEQASKQGLEAGRQTMDITKSKEYREAQSARNKTASELENFTNSAATANIQPAEAMSQVEAALTLQGADKNIPDTVKMALANQLVQKGQELQTHLDLERQKANTLQQEAGARMLSERVRMLYTQLRPEEVKSRMQHQTLMHQADDVNRQIVETQKSLDDLRRQSVLGKYKSDPQELATGEAPLLRRLSSLQDQLQSLMSQSVSNTMAPGETVDTSLQSLTDEELDKLIKNAKSNK